MKLIGCNVFLAMSIALIFFGSIAYAGEQTGIKQEAYGDQSPAVQTVVRQETHGDQSPVVYDANTVIIIYQSLPKAEREYYSKQTGNNQQLIDRLSKELEVKIKNEDANKKEKEKLKAEIQAWAKKYEALSTKISQMPGDSDKSAKAKEALVEGDLKKAESFTIISGVSGSGVSFGGSK